MQSENPTSIYEARIDLLIAAGLLSQRREPVGISLFKPLPPLLHEIPTRRVSGEGGGLVFRMKRSALLAIKGAR